MAQAVPSNRGGHPSSRPSRSSQGAAATAIAAAPTLRAEEITPSARPCPDYTAHMLRGRRAAIAAAFAIAAVAAVTAGCGGGTTSALQFDPVAAAATKTQQAGAARIRFAMGVSGPRLQGKTLRLRGTGAVDGTSSEMSFRLPSMVGLPGPNLTHSTIKEVALEQNGDYVIYVQLGFLASQLPGGKQWIKLDLSKLGKSAGVDLGKLLSGSQFEPSDLLSMLRAEGAKVHKLSPATVDGTATTHYRVTINMAKALQSKGLTSPLFSRVAAQAKAVSENVWVGSDGLVRRVRFAYSVPKAATRLAMTMDLYDYGAHVSIAAPPSSQVFDATQFATQFAQQGLAGATH